MKFKQKNKILKEAYNGLMLMLTLSEQILQKHNFVPVPSNISTLQEILTQLDKEFLKKESYEILAKDETKAFDIFITIRDELFKRLGNNVIIIYSQTIIMFDLNFQRICYSFKKL
jgi:hypothetical protein